MRNKFCYGLMAMSAVICAVVCIQQPDAKADTSLTVSPGIIELNALPATSISTNLKVSNTSQVPANYVTAILPGMINEKVSPGFRGHYDMSTWVITSPSVFTLAPKEHRDIAVQVSVPPNTPPGGYYADVFVKQNQAASSQTTVVQGGIGSRILFTVDGTQTHHVDIQSLDVRKGPHKKITAVFTAKNSGSVHEKLNGFVLTRNMKNHVVDRENIGAQLGFIFPHTERKFQVVAPAPGPGKYRFELVLKYSSLQTTKQSNVLHFARSIWFWIFIFLGVIAVVVGGTLLFKRVVGHASGRVLEDHSHSETRE